MRMKNIKRVIGNKKTTRAVFEIKKRRPTKEEKLAAARRVRGMWAFKDTSFFDKGLRLIVEDNGQGFIPATNGAKKGLGLFSMQERATLLGGKVTVESTPGRGTTIYADIPVTT